MLEPNTIIEKLQHIFPKNKEVMALHEPCFQGNEWNYVKECIDTGWVSSVGKFVDRFEHDLAQFTQSKHAIATVNGTAALHISYLVAGVKPNDEVLVPTLTFVGTINPIIYCGAIPHFIDSEEISLGINPERLDDYLSDIVEKKGKESFNRLTGRCLRALCVMHTLGHPVDLDPLLEIAQKYHLILIEDAAEAFGSYYKDIHVGNKGLIGTLSFNGNKTITTGGGGAILTNNSDIAKKAKHLTTTAKLPHPWAFEHDCVGYNYRLPNINAALGCAQLEQFPQFLHNKRLLAEKYVELFHDLNLIRIIKEPAHCRSNYWLNAFVLDTSVASLQNNILELLIKNNIMARPLWNLQHQLNMFRDCPRMPLPVSEGLAKRLIKLPSSPQLLSMINTKFLYD